MKAGARLCWYGDNGPELGGFPFWPQKRTVRALLQSGHLKWKDYLTPTHRECGICEIGLGGGSETELTRTSHPRALGRPMRPPGGVAGGRRGGGFLW